MSHWGPEAGPDVECPHCGAVTTLHRDQIGEQFIRCSSTQGGDGCGRIYGALIERKPVEYVVKTAKMGEYE
jgi:hypothetical protein